jgi:IS5 family transposase
MSDHKGAALIYPMLPDAETIIADKGYDSDAFRDALAGRGITPCIHRELSAGRPQHTARLCIDSATRSRICSQG